MIQRKRHNPIGVDLGAAAIKARQTDAQGQTIASLVLPRRSRDAASDPAELTRLAAMLDRHGFVGRRVVAACPWSGVVSEPLRLPPVESGAPRRELAVAELARLRQLTPGSFEVGFWPIPTPARGGEGAFVMATAATHEQANAVTDHFEEAGLELVALDTPATALCRGVWRGHPSNDEMTLLIDLGSRQARSVVLAHGAVVFERGNDETGLDHLLGQIGEALLLEGDAASHLLRKGGLTPTSPGEGDTAMREALAEARSLAAAHFDMIARDLAMAINYVGHRYPELAVESTVVTGGGAMLPGVRDYLASALGLAMHLPTVGDPGAGDAPLLVLAHGLALHGDEAGRAAA